ncbi:hypothetical protein Q7A_1638 [Methylophaga nitratireducenticrescens]|uniref:Uncharacterized protein n=1 Tax=Methylophaga nitratireducenticrescens TaxID=754476 RepID=I1XJ93_METNJ|nr:hypothetical protein [Methylophaga nitratireducenticrescens]AFI84462.1 hypothetical protein Q7A_1638 [Methylophaga nitratireducenticrescens]
MKNLKLAIAVSSALSVFASIQAMADWENLPAAGVSVGSDTSAYILCNPTGNFGWGRGASADVQPSSITDACAVLPLIDLLAPDANFTGADLVPKESRTVAIYMDSYTGGNPVDIGTFTEYVWQREVQEDVYECIYGMKVVLKNADYNDDESGTQNFEVNDMARKGWNGKMIDVAYSTVPAAAFSTYRIGRTFTSVKYGSGSGYVDQPPTGLGAKPAITYTQNADLESDWVDFTTLVHVGTTDASGMQYIRTSCTAEDFSTVSDAIRLRQTSRDGQPAIEVEVEGFIPN